MPLAFAAPLLVCLLATEPSLPAESFFRIQVVDEQTGRGVPLVELKTTGGVKYYTDSAGLVAFYEPGLMDQKVFFHVRSHGYEFPADGFGIRGQALDVKSGGEATLKIKRRNIAERLYRVTGGGIYADSVLLGRPAPLKQPVLNAQVFGSDSVVNAEFRGRIYWFWGDTNRPRYPLGNFQVPGATSRLPTDGGLDPHIGVDLHYFTNDEGFAKETARMPGSGPTWINGLVVVPDAAGRQRMFATYVKVRKFLEIYERGLVEFDPDKQAFEKVAQFELSAPLFPTGHPFRHVVDGVEYIYFADPYPLTRVRATAEAVQNLAEYEAFTCLAPGSRAAEPKIDRDENGPPRYGWKRDTAEVGYDTQAKLVRDGLLKENERWLNLRDAETGKPVIAHRGSVCWNEFRRRWIMIATETGGTSPLGEVWYSEADAPEGPWRQACKIVTHDKYSFYNPKQHPMFDQAGGRFIFFEGTYTHTFSGNPDQTPRYDYNQIMYKLDLADPRLKLNSP